MKQILKKLYHALPLWLRYRISFLAWWLTFMCQKINNTILPPVVAIKPATDSNHKLIFGYIGGIHKGTRFYLSEKIAGHNFILHDLGRHWVWRAHAILIKNHPDCVLVFNETFCPRLSSSSKTIKTRFKLPCWVDMHLDFPERIEENGNEQFKSILRKIKKNRLTYAIIEDQKEFDKFYYDLYRPFIKGRFTGSALVGEYARLKKQFLNGGLLLVKQFGEVLGGALFDIHRNSPRFRVMGIKDNNRDYVQLGVIGAFYYYLIMEMKKRGYHTIHLGGSRPFLRDGVTRFKISLGAQLDERNRNSCLNMTILKDTPGVWQFLAENPFMHMRGRQLRCAFFFRNKSDFSGRTRRKIEDGSRCPGTKGHDLFFQ